MHGKCKDLNKTGLKNKTNADQNKDHRNLWTVIYVLRFNFTLTNPEINLSPTSSSRVSNVLFQDKDFGKKTLHKGHANPLAEVTTSLKTYQHFTLEKAYLGEDFFWAFTPVAGDFIRMRFYTPVRLERLVPSSRRTYSGEGYPNILELTGSQGDQMVPDYVLPWF